MPQTIDAIVLAGGKGTRLAELTRELPKPLLKVCGKPILDHILDWLEANGIARIYVSTGYQAEKIHRHLDATGRKTTLFVQEREPLGTAGAVLEIAKKHNLSDPFFVIYGDEISSIELTPMLEFHNGKKAEATLLVGPSIHPHDSDLLELDEGSRITVIHPKPHEAGKCFHNLSNKALYVLTKKFLQRVPGGKAIDFGREVFPSAASEGARMFGYQSGEYIFDVGTKERLAQAEEDLKMGRNRMGSAKRPRPCVFLDRDGVINFEINGVLKPEDLKIIEGIPECIGRLNREGVLVIVTTNQPYVAKGMLSLKTLDEIHKRLEWELGMKGAYMDKIYFCPHHPEKGHAGEVPGLKIDCGCRKPKAGMIDSAFSDFHIDGERSVVVGDSERDVGMARAAKIDYYKVEPNSSPGEWLEKVLKRLERVET